MLVIEHFRQPHFLAVFGTTPWLSFRRSFCWEIGDAVSFRSYDKVQQGALELNRIY